MPDIEGLTSKIQEARQAGYSDDDIIKHLAKTDNRVSEALKSGHSTTDVIKYLTTAAPQPVEKPVSPQEAAIGIKRHLTPEESKRVTESRIPGVSTFSTGVDKLVTGVDPNKPNRPGWDVRLGGASEAVRGAMEAVAPVAIPVGLAAAPVQTAVGLAAGMGAGAAAEHGATALGAPEGVSQAVGDVAGLVAGGAAAHAAPSWGEIFRVKPEVAVNRVFRPRTGETDFPEVAPAALSELKTYGGMPTIKSNADALSAVPVAKKRIAGAFDAWLQQARRIGTQRDGSAIVAATRQSIPETFARENPDAALAMIQEAEDAYGNGQQFTVDQLHRFLREKNAEAARYHNMVPADATTARTVATNAARAEAQAAAIRNTLYEALDPLNRGAGPRELQARMGTVKEIERSLQVTGNRAQAEKPVSMAEQASRFMLGGPKAWGQFLHGDFEGAAGLATSPRVGPTDAMIERIMKALPDAGPLPMPAQAPQPRGLLGPGAVRMPPATPTPPEPYVPYVDIEAPSRRLQATKQLPEPTIKLPGVEPDDPVFEPYTDVMRPYRETPKLRLLPPAGSSPQPTSPEIGSQVGDVVRPPLPVQRPIILNRAIDRPATVPTTAEPVAAPPVAAKPVAPEPVAAKPVPAPAPEPKPVAAPVPEAEPVKPSSEIPPPQEPPKETPKSQPGPVRPPTLRVPEPVAKPVVAASTPTPEPAPKPVLEPKPAGTSKAKFEEAKVKKQSVGNMMQGGTDIDKALDMHGKVESEGWDEKKSLGGMWKLYNRVENMVEGLPPALRDQHRPRVMMALDLVENAQNAPNEGAKRKAFKDAMVAMKDVLNGLKGGEPKVPTSTSKTLNTGEMMK